MQFPRVRFMVMLRRVGANADFPVLVREFAFFVGVKRPEEVKVGFDVAGGVHHFADAQAFIGVIEIAKGDWHFCREGHVIKAGFPIFGAFASAFRGDNHDKFVALSKFIGKLFDKVGVGTAVDRDAPQPAHENPQRPPKEIVFGEEVEFNASCHRKKQSDRQVPVGGVVGPDKDVFFLGRVNGIYAPAN